MGWLWIRFGGMYDFGFGVRQDKIEAYKWYCLAAAQGNTTAANNRDKLLKSLLPEQIAEGQRRAAAFVRRK